MRDRPVAVVLRLRPPGPVQRMWYRRLGIPVPLADAHVGPWHAGWVRLLPYRWRGVHAAYARRYGFFWMPCPLCGRCFGGHESGGAIPDPLSGPGRGISICAPCTRATTCVPPPVG